MNLWERLFNSKNMASSRKTMVLNCEMCGRVYRLGIDAMVTTSEKVMSKMGGIISTGMSPMPEQLSPDMVSPLEGTINDPEGLWKEQQDEIKKITSSDISNRYWKCYKCGSKQRYPLGYDNKQPNKVDWSSKEIGTKVFGKVIEVNNNNRGAYVWPDKEKHLVFVTFSNVSEIENMPKLGDQVEIEYASCEVGDKLATVTGPGNKIYTSQKVVIVSKK